ncbi:hypothetical protein M6D81_17590 [Paenibacillus sp. J5C_2022]|uniref:hypothetical protein n=1 Tax=Paenibacillus sp. J5C2022 TaxID=2977129 RepID=UPI0021D2FA31|nr:hypothetical protein [Paenibacillus sp. J5C2022]MCU6710508.1 hypothetical protein [Paenibacillus sp. J5C2022]
MMSAKIAAYGSFILITAIVLASCGLMPSPNLNSESNSIYPEREEVKFANKELSIAVFEGAYGKAYWEAVIERFEADFPGVRITMISNPKVMDIIKPLNVSGNPPDFIYAPLSDQTNTVQKMLIERAFLDLTELFDSKALDKDVPLKDIIMDDILDFAKPYGDGKIYMAPTPSERRSWTCNLWRGSSRSCTMSCKKPVPVSRKPSSALAVRKHCKL